MKPPHAQHPSARIADALLEALYGRRGFASVFELEAQTHLSRRQIEEACLILAQRGQRIESLPSQGMRLVRPAGLDSGLIERGLGTARIGRHVICFDEVDSTNDVALDSARQAGSDGTVVLAESQRKGRGRLGRQWTSPPRANILMSVLLEDPAERLPHECVTIAAGLAAAEGIEAATGVRCQLKWPNDLLIGPAKTGGILVEMRPVAPGDGRAARRCICIGVGLNVNAAPPPGTVNRPVACLAEQAGGELERIEIVRAILGRLDFWMVAIAYAAGQMPARDAGGSAGGANAELPGSCLHRLHEAWRSRSSVVGQRMAILCDGVRHAGRVLDVSPLEGLILCRDDGATVYLPARNSSVVD